MHEDAPSDEQHEDDRRYEEAGVVNRRHLTDAVLQVAIRQLPHHDPLVVTRDQTVQTVVELMRERRHGGVVVVDGQRRVCGIFTERDVLYRIAATDVDPAVATVGQHMTTDPVTLRPTDSIGLALNRMSVGGYRHVPLVEADGTPVGVLSMRDVARFIAEFFPESALNVPPDATTVADEAAGG